MTTLGLSSRGRIETAGYYRFPTLHGQTVVFVCEDDLWTVPDTGGIARRLTSNLGAASYPFLSPDGTKLAFIGREEGHTEVYVMPALGGPARRLTYLGSMARVVGWCPNGESILFTSNAGQPFQGLLKLFTVSLNGGLPQELPIGPAQSISYAPDGGVVIGRNTGDPARWKRYRGGTAGELWVDVEGNGQFRRLIQLEGNLANPMWLGERIFFLSDHEGVGNLYSCLPTGEDLKQHTTHQTFYARNASTDGQRIVYHAGADLYVYDPASDASQQVAVEFRSPRTQRNRKFVDTARYMLGYAIHPEGHSVAVTSRGKPFTMANWEGAVLQHGEPDGTRYRLASWLSDGKRLVMVADTNGEEALEIHHADGSKEPDCLSELSVAPDDDSEHPLDIGRPVSLAVSPRPAPSTSTKLSVNSDEGPALSTSTKLSANSDKGNDLVVLSNHRYELILVDLASRTMRLLDRSQHARIHGIAWSPDGRWVAYGFADTQNTSCIKLCKVETGETWPVTRPVLFDVGPAFDPDGKYLYFLSYREFDPVYDNMHFDLNFPRGMRPYLITLQKDLPSPFIPLPRAPGQSSAGKDEQLPKRGKGEDKQEADCQEGEETETPEEPVIEIDLDGIKDRIVAFPVWEGLYGQVWGGKGKVLFTSLPIEGSLGDSWVPGEPSATGFIEMYDFEEQKQETLVRKVTNFRVSADGKTMTYRAGNHLRVIEAGKVPDDSDEMPGRKSGWLDLTRIKVSVQPRDEWEQMYREAWRLQRDHFWTEDMSGVDWEAVNQRYRPLLDRVATRSEFSDLMWEMQGELGTSHAYELGGDYRQEPKYLQGFLGVDFVYDAETETYRIGRIVRGDPWDEWGGSPLLGPGINVEPGQSLLAINGRKVGKDCSPQELLVNQAGSEVLLTFERKSLPVEQKSLAAGRKSLTVGRKFLTVGRRFLTVGQRSLTKPPVEKKGEKEKETRIVSVKALRSETPARYRDWVEGNRRQVHEATDGRVGYVHIPDMGPRGYAEFHRGYLAEVGRDALIVDVRFNGGGHVSQLILEKLARRRLGYDVPRWGEPEPYPVDSVLGPMVAITNEQAGSDGDIFSHSFKLMNLGPLIGKRTWGGVVGTWARDRLVDGSVVTQPEFSFWFEDVGWGVENYGADPDIEVDITPQDYAAGKDTQLERAIEEILRLLEEQPPKRPDFKKKRVW